MSATINAFPPLHAFNSSRSWFLAIIVLLHLGFFWALTSGLSVDSMRLPEPRSIVKLLPAPPKPSSPVKREYDPIVERPDYVPLPPKPTLPPETASENVLRNVTHEAPPITPRRATPDPVIVEPAIDERAGLSEPVYPTAEIRMQHAGTVLLSVQVLVNGRVGAVRIDRSSGHPRLDESAVREARRWRLVPGTRDGVPAVLWKQIPVTFQLRN